MVAKSALLAFSLLSFPSRTDGLPGIISAFEDGTLTISVPEISTGTKPESALSELGDSVLLGVSTFFVSNPSQQDASSISADEDQDGKQEGISLFDDAILDPGTKTDEDPARTNMGRNRRRRFKHGVAPLVPEIGEVVASDTQQGDQGAIAGL